MLWYLLEAPRRGASNEHNNVYFRGKIRKITFLDEKLPDLELC